ncbi:MAG TPA: rhomboid family intramembrane serine protease [Parasegetibacter sp.]
MAQFRPGNFQILPLIIKNLLIINVLVYLAQTTMAQMGLEEEINALFALHHVQSPLFRLHQLISHMFMHGSWEHLFFNMFALWMFGSVLENYWGPKRFLIFYIACGLGAACIHLLFLGIDYNQMVRDMELFTTYPSPENFINFYDNHLRGVLPSGANAEVRSLADTWAMDPANSNMYLDQAQFWINSWISKKDIDATVGASGAVFGCLAAFGYLFPNSYIYLYFFIPIKVKWFVLGYAAIEFVLAIQNSAGDNVAHWAHLGGALVGFLLVYFWNKTNRRTFY